ncbi:hypothetical protein [Vulcanisaeta distributa]|uniref:hypothetical protein n=1 Tax=Vulcanisaeta distributa TaxID=164451 RepID=UPI0006D1F552|nr:hypothetical protein [Vulcanisaeta distributa]
MRHTVIIATVLFIATIIVLIYYVVFMDNGQFLVGNTNKALDALMLSLVIVSGIITGIVYLFSSKIEKGGSNVQTVQHRGGEVPG